jgi:hypothetical protein
MDRKTRSSLKQLSSMQNFTVTATANLLASLTRFSKSKTSSSFAGYSSSFLPEKTLPFVIY